MKLDGLIGLWREPPPEPRGARLEITRQLEWRIRSIDLDDGETLVAQSIVEGEDELTWVFAAPSRSWIAHCCAWLDDAGNLVQSTTHAEEWKPGVASQREFDLLPDHCVARARIEREEDLGLLEDVCGVWWSPWEMSMFEFSRSDEQWTVKAWDLTEEFLVRDVNEERRELHFTVEQSTGFWQRFRVMRSTDGRTIGEVTRVSHLGADLDSPC